MKTYREQCIEAKQVKAGMIDIAELERINNAGDRYGQITPGVVAELIAEVRKLRFQQFELMGVVVDVEQGNGFDVVCLATIKRVMGVLGGNP